MLKLCVWYFTIFGLIYKTSAQDPVANLPQGRIVGKYSSNLSRYRPSAGQRPPVPRFSTHFWLELGWTSPFLSIKAYTEGSVSPVEIYYGVPYATPPKGRYRFSAPERHVGWRRTFFAHRIPPHCPHIGNGDSDNYSEDCLYLNIWTPRRSDGKTLPVVVILYSESWTKGGISLPCQELAADGVVVVTVMYRLHLLAFFTLRSISARGNLALLDQYLAFLWVRDNIAAFGGDPTAITVLGHSAGADSLLYHITSPRSIGLFQRAIIMSPFDIWKALDEKSVIEVTEVEQISREIASLLGCKSDKDQEILQCMRERPLSDIMAIYSNETWSRAMQPISDRFLPISEQFLPNSLLAALSASKSENIKLDVMLGACDLEGLHYNDDEYKILIKRGKSYLFDYANKEVIPQSLRLLSLDRLDALPMLSQAVRWEYLSDKSRKSTETLNSIEFIGRVESSAKWSAGIALIAARLARKVNRLYVYRYSQPAGVDLQGRNYNFTGAAHGTDLVSLLGDALMLQVARRPSTVDEKRISLLFQRYVINFIKFGSPEDESLWQRYKTGDAKIYDIHDVEASKTSYHSSDRDVRFWLQYLPELINLLQSAEKTEQLTGQKEENRLRGGVFAMCGLALVLLLLLCICAILLHRQRSRHFTVANDDHH